MSTSLAIEKQLRSKIRHLRWYMAALLVLVTAIDYLDRQ